MRLTEAKIQKWHDKLERAAKTIENVERDIKAVRLDAKGGDLSALTDLMYAVGAVRDLSNSAVLPQCEAMIAREKRKADK